MSTDSLLFAYFFVSENINVYVFLREVEHMLFIHACVETYNDSNLVLS